ncbi:MAG: hypothetical protein Q9227_007398 [Pyrenula ochraceoflavens]
MKFTEPQLENWNRENEQLKAQERQNSVVVRRDVGCQPQYQAEQLQKQKRFADAKNKLTQTLNARESTRQPPREVKRLGSPFKPRNEHNDKLLILAEEKTPRGPRAERPPSFSEFAEPDRLSLPFQQLSLEPAPYDYASHFPNPWNHVQSSYQHDNSFAQGPSQYHPYQQLPSYELQHHNPLPHGPNQYNQHQQLPYYQHDNLFQQELHQYNPYQQLQNYEQQHFQPAHSKLAQETELMYQHLQKERQDFVPMNYNMLPQEAKPFYPYQQTQYYEQDYTPRPYNTLPKSIGLHNPPDQAPDNEQDATPRPHRSSLQDSVLNSPCQPLWSNAPQLLPQPYTPSFQGANPYGPIQQPAKEEQVFGSQPQQSNSQITHPTEAKAKTEATAEAKNEANTEAKADDKAENKDSVEGFNVHPIRVPTPRIKLADPDYERDDYHIVIEHPPLVQTGLNAASLTKLFAAANESIRRYGQNHGNNGYSHKDFSLTNVTIDKIAEICLRTDIEGLLTKPGARFQLLIGVMNKWFATHIFNGMAYNGIRVDYATMIHSQLKRPISGKTTNEYEEEVLTSSEILEELKKDSHFPHKKHCLVRERANKLWTIIKPMNPATRGDWPQLVHLMGDIYNIVDELFDHNVEVKLKMPIPGQLYDPDSMTHSWDPFRLESVKELVERGARVRVVMSPMVACRWRNEWGQVVGGKVVKKAEVMTYYMLDGKRAPEPLIVRNGKRI